MLITRRSTLTGKVHTRDIPVTDEEIADWQRSGDLIQRALPNLTPSQREFLLTGTTDEEWDAAFPDEDEDEEGDHA